MAICCAVVVPDGIGDLDGHESDLGLVAGYGKHREQLERSAGLRGAEILLECAGGVDVDRALRQRFARECRKT